jgi:hypothetical protein
MVWKISLLTLKVQQRVDKLLYPSRLARQIKAMKQATDKFDPAFDYDLQIMASMTPEQLEEYKVLILKERARIYALDN